MTPVDTDLDLNSGDKTPETEEVKKPRGRPKGSTNRPKTETDLSSRLESVFTRVSETLERRGDIELASIIREDTKAMAGGIIAVTKSIKGLRPPLLFLLTILDPLLAFGRLLGVMARRFAERRQAPSENETVEQPNNGNYP